MNKQMKDALAVLNRALPGLPAELATRYARLALTRGTRTMFAEAHDAWCAWHGGDTDRLPDQARFGRLHLMAIHLTAAEVNR
jgi:hypothetical protein